jgi:hypothetical protein
MPPPIVKRGSLQIPPYKRIFIPGSPDPDLGIYDYEDFDWTRHLVAVDDDVPIFNLNGVFDFGLERKIIRYPRFLSIPVIDDPPYLTKLFQSGFMIITADGGFDINGEPTALTWQLEPNSLDTVTMPPFTVAVGGVGYHIKNTREDRWVGGDALFIYKIDHGPVPDPFFYSAFHWNGDGTILPLTPLITHDQEVLNRIASCFNRVEWHFIDFQDEDPVIFPRVAEISAILETAVSGVSDATYYVTQDPDEVETITKAAIHDFYEV